MQSLWEILQSRKQYWQSELRHNQKVAIMTWLAVRLKEHLFDKLDRCANPIIEV